jgi:hypothetical protein
MALAPYVLMANLLVGCGIDTAHTSCRVGRNGILVDVHVYVHGLGGLAQARSA